MATSFPPSSFPSSRARPLCPRARRSISAETNGKWKVLFYWPKDFTFVCPTEIVGYGELQGDFADRDARADRRLDRHRARPLRLAPVGRAARRRRDFPWIADNKKELAEALGILDREEGVAFRATFIVDPDNVIQHVTVNGLNVGRNPPETLRVLDALQTDELCPCNWTPGRRGAEPPAA